MRGVRKCAIKVQVLMILTVDEGFDGVLGCEYEFSDEGTGLCVILLDCWEG